MKSCYCYLLTLLLLAACSGNGKSVKNEFRGKLTATKQLVETGEKRFRLDTDTKVKPPYIQVCTDEAGDCLLTFLNNRKNAIYFYRYSDTTYLKQIAFEREGADAIMSAGAYYIKSPDSIYVFNRPLIEIALADSSGRVHNRVTLLDKEDKEWALHNPQYMFSPVVPLMLIDNHLILPGMSPFPENLADRENFRFTACIDLATNKTEYHHLYPEELFGNGYNWGGDLILQPYPAISPEGKMVHSFTCSHDLYISDWNTDAEAKVYGGGNAAGTIRSIDHEAERTPDELVYACFLEQDLYAALLYDPFRKVYYRYLQRGLPDADMKTPIDRKPLTIIVMDDQFRYLGETEIGTGQEWNWTNSFVTAEGLNIEHIGVEPEDDDYLTFGLFNLKDL